MTNTLYYYAMELIKAVKNLELKNWPNKLECLFLASLFT
jgi:hypothetical protein